MATFDFTNAYRVNTATTPAGKEANSHDIIFDSLGAATIDDDTNSELFSGNDVAAIGINIGGTMYYGWISRPVKSQGDIKAFYFWTDPDFVNLAAATADGNQDGDGDTSDNIGFILVVDQSFFDALGWEDQGANLKNVGSSSDRVDSALNSLLAANAAPIAVADIANGTPGTSGGAALEAGYGVATQNATGNVLTNDTDADSDALTVTNIASDSTANSSAVTSGSAGVVAGLYGTLTLNANGSYSYAVDNASTAVQALLPANTLTESFTYSISDGNGGTATTTLTVQIKGSNDAPTAANDFGSAKEGTTVGGSGFASAGKTAEGNVLTNDRASDVDQYSETHSISGTSVSTTGSVSSNTLVFSAAQTSISAKYVYVGTTALLSTTGAQLKATVSGTTLTFTDAGTGLAATPNAASLALLNGTNDLLFYSDSAGHSQTNTITDSYSIGGSATVSVGSVVGISVGATVTGTGIPASTTVTAIDATAGTVTLSASVSISAGTSLSFGKDSGGASITMTGVHGTLVLDADGHYVYTANTDDGTLSSGQSATETFNYTMHDAAGATSSATLTITVLGAGSSDPVAADDAGSATEQGAAGGTDATGNLLTNDSGPGTNVVAGVHAAGVAAETAIGSGTVVPGSTYGTLTVSSTGAYTYAVDNANTTVNALQAGETLTETFYYRITNAPTSTGSAVATLTITINGANDAPIAVNDSATATEASGLDNAEAGWNPGGNVLANDTDVDDAASELRITAIRTGSSEGLGTAGAVGSALVGTYGSLTLASDGSWTYTLDNTNATVNALAPGQTLTDSFNYTVTDRSGSGLTDIGVLNVTIDGAADTIAVNSVFVNESSDYAVFTVSGAAGVAVTLALSDTTGLSATDAKADLVNPGADIGSALQYFDGTTWTAYNAGTPPAIPAGGQLFVRVAVVQDDVYESNESFTLTAATTSADAATATGIGTVNDEGQGDIFLSGNNTGTPNTSGDAGYPALDDDRPTLSVTDTTLTEGATAEFTVSIDKQSKFDISFVPVIEGFSATIGADTADASTLEFSIDDGANWDPVTGAVTIAAGQSSLKLRIATLDDLAQELTETFTVSTGYVDVVKNQAGGTGTATLHDNDATSGLTVSETTVTTSETGTQATFTVRLDAQPASDVTVTITGADGTEGSLSSTTLTFTNLNWDQDQTVTVTGLDDSVIDGDTGYVLTLTTSGDSAYNGVNSQSATVSVTNTDDDVALVTVSGAADVSEGSSAVFTVTLDKASDFATEISLTLGDAGDSAEAADYSSTFTAYYYDGGQQALTITGGKISLPAGVTTFYVNVPTTDDGILEGAETFTLTAAITGGDSDAGTATVVDDGTGTVYDDQGAPTADAADDDSPTITVSGAADVSEGSNAVFTVTLSNASDLATEISLTLGDAGDSAEAADYSSTFTAYYYDGGQQALTITGGKISLPAGVTTFYVNVPTTDDAIFEGGETFTLTAAITAGDSDAGTATIVDDGTGTVYDDQGVPTLDTPDDDQGGISVSGPSDVSEGGNAVFTVVLGAVSALPTEISLTLGDAGDTAEAADYSSTFTAYYYDGGQQALTITGGKISLPAGVTTFYVNVPTTDNAIFEGAETFTLTAAITAGDSDADTATIVDDGTGKVYDDQGVPTPDAADDDSPILTVTGAADVSEGGNAVFTITLSNASDLATEIALTLGDAGDTAEAADYSSTFTAYYYDGGQQALAITGGKISLPAGVTTFYVNVPTTDNAIFEGAETFTLTAVITGGDSDAGTATIVDDGTGTVYDDQGVPTAGAPDDDSPTITVSGAADVSEGSNAVFTVTLSNASDLATEISLTLGDAGDSAEAADYSSTFTAYYYDGGQQALTITGGKISLPAGVTTFYVSVPTTDNAIYEGAETFTLTAAITGGDSDADTATIVDDGTGAVYDDQGVPTAGAADDDSPTITVSGAADVSEGSNAVFTVTLGNASDLATEIALTLGDAGDSAEAADYSSSFTAYYYDGGQQALTITGGKISLPAGVTTFYVNVPTTDNAIYEGAETFTLTAAITGGDSDAGTATIVDDGTGTVYDDQGVPTAGAADDDSPTITVSGATDVSEGSNAVFTVTLGNASDLATEISLTLGDAGDSAEAADYSSTFTAYYYDGGQQSLTITGGKISLPAGVTTFYVNVPTTDNAIFEGAETFTLTAAITGGDSDADTATIVDDGTGTVYDDQGAPTAGAADDDSPTITVSGAADVSEGSNAVFTVTLGNASDLPTEISLSLGDAGDTAEAADYSSTLTAYYYDGGQHSLTITGGKISLPAGVTTFYVNVPTTDNAIFEGAETFTLTAAITGGDSDAGTATIVDDGTGTVYDDQGAPTADPADDDSPTITVSGAADVSEGSNAVFTVTLSNASDLATEISLTLGDAGDSAEAADYSSTFTAYYYDGGQQALTITGGKISLPAGVTTFYVSVPTTDNAIYEGAETFTLTAAITGGDSDADTATIVDDGTGTVYDDQGVPTAGAADDDKPTITVTGASGVSEGSHAIFTVSLSNASDLATEIALTLGDGADTAQAGDYASSPVAYYYDGTDTQQALTLTAGKLTLPAGVTTFYVSVGTTDDAPAVYEGSETFTLTAAITGGGSDAGTASIVDDGSGKFYNDKGQETAGGTPDDDQAGISVNGAADVSEGSNAVFTVTLTTASALVTEISLGLGSGADSAEASDYDSTLGAYYFDGTDTQQWLPVTDGKIQLPAGVTLFYVSVATNGDSPAVYEGAETFTLSATITGGSGDSGAATIVDDGSGSVYDDRGLPTADTPDDDRPTITVSGASDVSEGGNAVFTITLGNAADIGTEIALSLGDAGDSAEAADYSSTFTAYYYDGLDKQSLAITAGKIALPAGVTTFYVNVPTTDNAVFEGAETFTLTAAITGGDSDAGTATIVDDGTGTVYDDRGVPTADAADDDSPTITVSGAADVSEGGNAVFTVTLGNASDLATEISLSLGDAGDSAEAADYSSTFTAYYYDGGQQSLTITGGKISLPAGVTTFYVNVPTTDNAIYEGAETFTLTAAITGGDSDAGTATIVDDGTGTVYDDQGAPTAGAADDDSPTITVSGATDVSEGSNAVFTVTLSNASDLATEISLSLGDAGDSAEAADYGSTLTAYYYDGGQQALTITGGKISLPAGVTTFYVNVPTTDDAIFEGGETFTLTAAITAGDTDAGSATIVDDGTGTVYDDQGAPTAGAADDDRPTVTVTGEGDVSEGSNAVFTIALSNASDHATEITLALGDGADSADASDYSAAPVVYYYDGSDTRQSLSVTDGKISLPAGVTTFYVSVATTDNAIYEGAETFTLTAAITGGDSDAGTATIVDDGSGRVHDDRGLPTADSADDDRPAITVTATNPVSEGSNAVYLVAVDGETDKPLQVALNVGVASDTAEPDDYLADGVTAYYFQDGAQHMLSIAGGQVTLPVGVTSFYVSVPTAADAPPVFEGAETLTLRAGLPGADADSATAIIVDDGTGVVHDLVGAATPGTPDDDRPSLTVTGLDDVSEGSNAVFTVALGSATQTAMRIALTLGAMSDTAEADDYAGTVNAYYVDAAGARHALLVTDGSVSLPAGVTLFYVAVATTDDQPPVHEGPEAFTLTAAIAGGDSDAGTSTILDDGTGHFHNDKGMVVAGGSPDNDLASISVAGKPDVSEGSNAVFTVTLSNASQFVTAVDLVLGAGSDTAQADDYAPELDAYYFDGDTRVALPVEEGKVMLPPGVTLFYVSVATTADQPAIYEGPESLTLSATLGAGDSDSGTSIITDDGTGKVYDERGAATTAAADDDRPAITVTGKADVSEGSNAVFTVELSHATDAQADVTLVLGDAADTAGAGDHSATLEAYYFDGAGARQSLALADGTVALPAGVTLFYVSVATTPDDVYEGAESLTLGASLDNGSRDSAVAMIVDDGTGTTYDERGGATASPADDDRLALAVSGVQGVSEGSAAIFTVTLSRSSNAAVEVALLLGASSDTAGAGDYDPAAEAYYFDGAGARQSLAIVDGKVTLPSGVTLFYVGVATTVDVPAIYEGAESLTLAASLAGGAAASGTSTIVDDGTGSTYDDRGQVVVGGPAPDDDRRMAADLDPESDNGQSNSDRITSIINPDFIINGGTLLQAGQTVRLVAPDGSIVGTAGVTAQDAAAGSIKVPTSGLDDGSYVFMAQIVAGNGHVVGESPVTVTVITDRDGVQPSVELSANGGDFNRDGIADWEQNNVAQLPLQSLADYLAGVNAPDSSFGAIMAGTLGNADPAGTVQLDPTAQLLNLSVGALPGAVPGSFQQASAVFNFSVTSQEGQVLQDMAPELEGLQTRVVIDLPFGVRADTYIKWDAPTGTWFEFLDDGNLDTYDEGATLFDFNHDGLIDRVVVTLTDGGVGDADGLANGIIVDPGMLALKMGNPVYSVLLADGDRYYTTDAAEAARMSEGAANVFEGVRFDSLDASQGGRALLANHNPFTGDWYFAAEGDAMPYICYERMPGAGFQAAAAGQGPGTDFHLFMNGSGQTQLVTLADADSLGLSAAGFSDRGAIFNTTTADAFVFDAEGYLVANKDNAAVQAFVQSLAATYGSTGAAGFVEAVEQNYLTLVGLVGLAHGGAATAADLNAAFGTAFTA